MKGATIDGCEFHGVYFFPVPKPSKPFGRALERILTRLGTVEGWKNPRC